jgi:hypothetical protein
MANKEHVAILQRGVADWNRWRAETPGLNPDLDGYNLSPSDDIRNMVNLKGINFSNTTFRKCTLTLVDLAGANLQHAYFWLTELLYCNLDDCDARHASFEYVKFDHVSLSGTRFWWNELNGSHFVTVDLSGATGLAGNIHHGMSIDVVTLELTAIGLASHTDHREDIERFYREAGVPQHLIDYYSARIGVLPPFLSVFISYSSADRVFARWLFDELTKRGVRCLMDEKHFRIGESVYAEMNRATQSTERMILCCSRNSLTSPWVDDEITMALAREKEQRNSRSATFLLPISLDNYLFDEYKGGKADLLRSRVAGRFQSWKPTATHGVFSALSHMLDSLRRTEIR